jgi:hypothetical protein
MVAGSSYSDVSHFGQRFAFVQRPCISTVATTVRSVPRRAATCHPERRGTVMSGYRLRTAVRMLPWVRMAFGALRRGYLREASRLAMRLRPFGIEFHGV